MERMDEIKGFIIYNQEAPKPTTQPEAKEPDDKPTETKESVVDMGQ